MIDEIDTSLYVYRNNCQLKKYTNVWQSAQKFAGFRSKNLIVKMSQSIVCKGGKIPQIIIMISLSDWAKWTQTQLAAVL